MYTSCRDPALDDYADEICAGVDDVVDAHYTEFNTSTSDFSRILRMYVEAQNTVPRLKVITYLVISHLMSGEQRTSFALCRRSWFKVNRF